MNKVFDFSRKKTLIEALIFYVFWAILSLVTAFLLASIYVSISGTDLANKSEIIGRTARSGGLAATIISFLLTYLILKSRRASSTKLWGFSILAGILVSFITPFGSLLIPTYFSTQK